MNSDPDRLRAAFADSALAWILERLRKRLQRGHGLAGSISLRNPTREQVRALAGLLGQTPRHGATVSVDLARLETHLQHAGLARSMAEAAQILLGEVTNMRELRLRTAQTWEDLFAQAQEAVVHEAAYGRWLDGLQSSGLLKRLARTPARGTELLQSALDLVLQFPLNALPISELAAKQLGDSHGLDRGRPVGTLAVRAAAALGDLDDWNSAEGRRHAWALGGVLLDELSAPLLVLNLRAADDSLASQALGLHAAHGEPYRLSIRQILRDRPRFTVDSCGPVVYVCENPSIVAAAANRLGAASAPLICTDGNPCTAPRLLLAQLRDAGIRLRYHGDFDWPGLQIGNRVVRRYGAESWRFGHPDYLSAASTDGKPLRGREVDAIWDEALRGAMARLGTLVHEEQVMDDLLTDLGRTD